MVFAAARQAETFCVRPSFVRISRGAVFKVAQPHSLRPKVLRCGGPGLQMGGGVIMC
jgi:hypothetical protein